MHFKLICAFVEDAKTDKIMEAVREAGVTGGTIINNARGEGMRANKTFLGLSLESQRDILFFLVEEHMSRNILELIAEVGRFEEEPGTGIAFKMDVDDVVGVSQQVRKLQHLVEDEL